MIDEAETWSTRSEAKKRKKLNLPEKKRKKNRQHILQMG